MEDSIWKLRSDFFSDVLQLWKEKKAGWRKQHNHQETFLG